MNVTVRLGTQASWALLSGCGRYRYVVAREFTEGPVAGSPIDVVDAVVKDRFLVWCLLNPSTADHERPDPTLDRCMTFARTWGYAGIYIVNAYAFRSSKPEKMPRLDGRPSTRAIGPENDELIKLWTTSRDVVVGWGRYATIDRARDVARLLSQAHRVDCLGTNKDGSPRHPLYLRKTTVREPWSPP